MIAEKRKLFFSLCEVDIALTCIPLHKDCCLLSVCISYFGSRVPSQSSAKLLQNGFDGANINL